MMLVQEDSKVIRTVISVTTVLVALACGERAWSGDLSAQLVEAAKRGDLASVRRLLAKGAEANAKDPKMGIPALVYAASGSHLPVVEALLAAGANIEARDLVGGTALIVAASAGRTPVVQALVGKGANVNARTRNGQTALMLAALQGHRDTVRSLLALGADPGIRDNFGRTASTLAAWKGHASVAEVLDGTASHTGEASAGQARGTGESMQKAMALEKEGRESGFQVVARTLSLPGRESSRPKVSAGVADPEGTPAGRGPAPPERSR
jgi:hypothetical protein